ncbi:hypothetical protein PCANC_26574 [Puccinia coronata f. sp. avenae]|uniref:Uncharacterized protein n=1 Tax=Puccinia coronata f. sp. avenae TaxID=200324 RepID=A0A2N5V3P9_9BASI|nr:hypothetical protein PCANC_26574 [Puccinia coronata f. sp. avenae]PLW44629.1 hypothetical protein PCASD_05145 [Puccinia coronata f. sp. avenae]
MASASDQEQYKTCRETPSKGVSRPSPHQFRAKLGAMRGSIGLQPTQIRRPDPDISVGSRGRSPHSATRSPPFVGLLGRPAKNPHPYSRNKLSSTSSPQTSETFPYKRASASLLPNKTSELRLRQPPCDENESDRRPNETVYRTENDRGIKMSRSTLQAPPSAAAQIHKSSQAEYPARETQVGLTAARSSGYSDRRSHFEESAEKPRGEINPRSDSDGSSEHNYSSARTLRREDPNSLSTSSPHPGAINQLNGSSPPAADRSSLASFTDVPISQIGIDDYNGTRTADRGGKEKSGKGENREAEALKRSAPFSKPGSRKRQFVSPPESHLSHTSSKAQVVASFDDFLSTVGEKNTTLAEELDRTVKENHNLRAQIDMNEVERRRYRESLKNLTSKILREKGKIEHNFNEMKHQMRDRLELEKTQSKATSTELGSLRKEIRESLEAFHSIQEMPGAQENDMKEPDCIICVGFPDARKAINVAKEVDEDRQKKQMVIDILRKELESKCGQVTEMSQRIHEIENLSGHQSIHMSRMEESWKEKSQKIQLTVQRKTELILGRLDEKYFLEEEKLRSRIEGLEKQISSQSQGCAEHSKELEVFRFKLEQSKRSLEIEQQDNAKHRQESSKLNNEISCAEAKICLLEGLASRLAKENFKLDASRSKIGTENISLRNRCVAFSEDLILHQNILAKANQDVESFKSKLEDRQSVLLALQACESANESSKLEVRAFKEKIEKIEDQNVMLETEKACMNLHLSECHLKIEDLEYKQKEVIQVSTRDFNEARRLHHETIDLKENIRKLEADLDNTKEENQKIQKDILSEKEQVISNQNREVQKLQAQVADLNLRNSELEMAGELRYSKETVDRLSETVNRQIHKQEEFDQLLKERLESEKRLTNMYEETKRLSDLLEKHEKEEGNLQARLKITQKELEGCKSEIGDLKDSNALQVSAAADILNETEKQASESRKQAVSSAREKAVAALEHKYELVLMNANNEKKRLAKQLQDSERRLLAMSAELAKAKGKPSLEECFSSSEHNDQTSRPPPIRKQSEAIVGVTDSDFIKKQQTIPKTVRVESQIHSQDNDHSPSQRESRREIADITQKSNMATSVVSQARNENPELQAAIPRASRFKRATRNAGVKKQTKRS